MPQEIIATIAGILIAIAGFTLTNQSSAPSWSQEAQPSTHSEPNNPQAGG